MKGIKLLVLAAATCAAVSSISSVFAAVSAPVGWYAEGNAGAARTQNNSVGNGTSSNTSGFAWNLNAGYKFMPYFGLELGYTNYATTNIKAPSGTKAARATQYSVDFAGKGILPISDSGVELFAKLGVARASSHIVITNGTAASGLNIPAGTKTATGLYMGVGGDYNFLPNLALDLQWQRTKAGSTIGNLDLYSIGLTWLFA